MLQQIKIQHFRNIESLNVSLDHKHVLILGENGQGKTNFLEAIYYLSFASSFRESKENIICQIGYDNFHLFGLYGYQGQHKDKLGVSWQHDKKQIKLNGQFLKDRKELLRYFPCISFFHNDLLLADGEMEWRRRFFDQLVTLIDPDFVDNLRRYKKILKQRNVILKQQQRELLPIYTEQLIETGLKLVENRYAVLDIFNKIFPKLFSDIAHLNIDIIYQPSWRNSDKLQILQLFHEKNEQEFKQGVTMYGPHRDRYSFMHDQREIASYFSLGQKRHFVLALKSSAAWLFYEQKKIKPILLLDDVLLELTRKGRESVLNHLPPYEQAFFAFLSDDNQIDLIKDSLIMTIENGKIKV